MVSDSIDNSIDELKLLTENFENNNYLDIIFHQIAMLNLKKGELSDDDKSGFTITDSTAINFFNKSRRSITAVSNQSVRISGTEFNRSCVYS